MKANQQNWHNNDGYPVHIDILCK